MPPKPKKRSAKAPAPLVDPDIADALVACKEAKIATRRLNEMREGDPGVEQQTAKAAAAQRSLILAGTNLATRLLIQRPSLPEESHEVQVALLELNHLVQQYRKAETDLARTQCTQLMQKVAKSLVEAGTKDGRFQVGKSWVPSVKDDEEGQNQRMYDHIEPIANDDEPDEDAFVPYREPRKPKTQTFVNPDGTIMSGDLETRQAIAEDKRKTGNDEEMADVEEHSKEHGHGDHEDAHSDVDVEAGSQESDPSVHPEGDTSSSTVGRGGQEQQGGSLAAWRQPLSEVGALCSVCDLCKPVSSFRLLWRGMGECFECEAKGDARLRSKD
ncbi:hypothetical protein GT037_009836 [Alternaria burnsii]|uniref:Uncharacterized protein n=1 Tax=Alternaria burnsii TaxID=1187904 RepID=A0A8H7AZ02_9PLEO|nr:uncharacterized protein GT037_009836 [Alternaria burnsii]KAF7671937.1 hypothetical protein GT037_009836 [Alternaria burnsii]CAI9629994.1 unnamed protein product [Alternaria burnsii]